MAPAPPAPTAAPPTANAAAAHATPSAHPNTPALGLALAAGALLVLGGVAYACFLLVGRARRAHLSLHPTTLHRTSTVHADGPASRASSEKGMRPLVLPAKVHAAGEWAAQGKAPRRMILSPLFQLPVYDLEELDRGAFTAHAGLSWRASLHAMGAAGAQVRCDLEGGGKVGEEDEDDVPLATHRAKLHRWASRLADVGSPDSLQESPVVATPRTPFEASAAPTKVVEVIQSRGASPDIVISEDCANLPSCISSSSSLASDQDRALLQVPPMSWTAPRAPDDVVYVLGTASQQPPAKKPRQRRRQSEGQRQVKKKSSVKKLVAALGDISNAIRLRPDLPDAPASPKKSSYRAATREGGRKENAF